MAVRKFESGRNNTAKYFKVKNVDVEKAATNGLPINR